METPRDPPGADVPARLPKEEVQRLFAQVGEYQRMTGTAFDYATPRQFLEFLKLLGVDQQQIAQQLGVSKTAVSLWATHRRPIPLHYRSALLTWAEVAWSQARKRLQKEAAAQPTEEPQNAMLGAFADSIFYWMYDVLTTATALQGQAHRAAQQLVTVLAKDRLTASDLEQIHQLRQALNSAITSLIATGGPPEDDREKGDASDA